MLGYRVARVGVFLCALMLGILIGSGDAYGSLITFDLSVEFSEATPPAEAAPWLNATFNDGGSPGSVVLTLTNTNLIGSEMVSQWIFNLDPDLNPGDLVFSPPTKTGSFTSPSISTGVNAFKADGDGKFDIKLAFATGGGEDDRFGAGEGVEYTITGIPSLTSGSFDFLSAPSGGHGPFPTAAHVQSIGAGEDSGWVSIPEPAAMSLLLVGAVGFVRRRRRKGYF